MDEINLSLKLPLDKDGFLRRECPYCEHQFKQWYSDTLELLKVYYCPYCYNSAPVDQWYTGQQIDYIQQIAMAEIIEPSLFMLQEQIDQANHIRIEMKTPTQMEPEALIEFDDMMRLEFPCHREEPIKVEEQWDKDVACIVCGTQYPLDVVQTISKEEISENLRIEQAKSDDSHVFISHSHLDKDRFVTDFATKLRTEHGINAWLDVWEIQPGDSLVEKVFEVGIRSAHTVIIVLSHNSIKKPWVKEEMDVSIVRRIDDKIRIIPVIIDDLSLDEMPMSLRATTYVKIKDLNNYNEKLKSIVDTIYGYSNRPPLGPAPTYIQNPIMQVPGLSKIDSLVLKLAGDKAIENGHRFVIDTQEILAQAVNQGISTRSFYESLVILGDNHYLDLQRSSALEPSDPELRELVRGGVSSFSITIEGFEKYVKTYIPEYKTIIQDVLIQIINAGKHDSASIADAIEQPLIIVNHILELFDRRGHIKILNEFGLETTRFMNISPALRRLLDNYNMGLGEN